MDEAKFRIGVDGKEELAQFFQRSEAGAKRFSGTVSTEMRKVGGEISSMAATAGRSLAALGGLGAGLGIVQTARSVLELRDQVQGVAAVAGLAEDKIAGLRQEIIAAGIATNNFGSDMGDALNEFVAKTGDIDKGRQSLELFGKVATATRSSAKDIAAIGADLQKLGITDQGKAFSILAKQSDVGAVELKDLVSQGPRLLAAFQGAGLSGEAGLRHGGALAQVFQQGTGNVERTSTAVEATFRDIAMRRDLLQNSGISVDGRDRTDVLKDIITKSKGNEFVLRRIFGDEAFRGVQVMASEFRKTGGFGSFDRFSNVAADGSTIDQKYALNTNSTLARAKAAQIQMQASGDRNFGDFLDQASGVLPSVSGAFDFATSHPLLAVGGGLAARSGLRMLGGALRGGRAGGGAGGALSGALGSAGLGIPVMVTNWPEGLGGSGGGLGKAIGEAVAEKAQLGTLARGFAAIGGNGGLAAIGAGVAATVAASVAVTSRLNAAMPQIRKETEDFIRSHQEDRAHAQLQEESGRDAGNLLLGTFGRFGGAFTAAQARAARQGAGSYGRNAADVLAGFGQQQDLLGVLARGEAGGVGEDLMRTDPQFALVLDALNASNPAFKNAKTGKDKAKVLQGLIAQNNSESFRAPRVDHTDDVSTPGGPSLPFGLDKLLGSATGDASRFASMMREALGLTFNITIGTDGDVTVDAPKGTRAPKVMANRGG
jgi:hypothetical protein